MSNPKSVHFAAFLLVLGFLVVLVLPLATTDFRATQKFSVQENRELNEFPDWRGTDASRGTFPKRFDAAFNDHFGFRALFTRWHSLLKVYVFGVSPVEKVVLGKQEWLYLSESTKDYRGVRSLSRSEVAGWVKELKTKQAWCAARHIRYLLVVVPYKESIYPEYLPGNICKIRDTHYLDDILKGLGADSGVEVVDLRETLLKGRETGLVFDRTDTHWSHLGAFLGTNEILRRLHQWYPGLNPVPLDQRKLTSSWGDGGDLARMMGLQDKLREERLCIEPGRVPFQPVPQKLEVKWPSGSLLDVPMAFESKGAEQNLTVLITGDSFGKGLLEFLPEHFSRVVRLRPDLPYSPWFQELLPKIVEAEKPDVYLDVYYGIRLKSPPKVNLK